MSGLKLGQSSPCLQLACLPPLQLIVQPAQLLVGPTRQEVGSEDTEAHCAAGFLTVDPSTAKTASPKVPFEFFPHQSRTFFASSASATSLWMKRGIGAAGVGISLQISRRPAHRHARLDHRRQRLDDREFLDTSQLRPIFASANVASVRPQTAPDRHHLKFPPL